MSQSRVKVSYSAPPLFLASDQWMQIRTALDDYLPLRNLFWRSATRTSIRTIQELDVDLLPLDSIRDEGASHQVPGNLLERPFVNLFIFACEDNEQYRTTYKKQIKDWHTVISARRNQEWLIIHVVKPDTRTGSRLFRMQAPVLDKVKADFNTAKKDRCVELTWPVSRGADDTQWTELIAKLKDGLVTSFDGYVTWREEEVRKLEGQRTLPGWNFCTFFVLKESLAASFEAIGLMEDAEVQYDELEASFFQVLKEKNLSWFNKFGGNVAGDDSAPILNVDNKPYRDLILANAISLFDFRIYLFACQCTLLGGQGRVVEALSKAQVFIGSFGRSLRENEKNLPLFFLESCIYSAATSIIAKCDAWTSRIQLDEQVTKTYLLKKAEFTELARHQLDKIGMAMGHLPYAIPFSLAWTDSVPPGKSERSSKTIKITNKSLVEVMTDRQAYDLLYVETTQKAIDLYVKSTHKKAALRLHGDLAALDQYRDRFPTAHQTFSSLPAHYTNNKWPPLESFMLARSLETHQRLGHAKDKGWIESVLALLRAWTVVSNLDGPQEVALPLPLQSSAITSEARTQYLEELINDMVKASNELEQPLLIDEHPSISVGIRGDAKCAVDQDGSMLDLVVSNHLPCPFNVEKVLITLSGLESDTLEYSSCGLELQPGDNKLSVSCPAPARGAFMLHVSEVQVSSKLSLTWTYPRDPSLASILSPASPLSASQWKDKGGGDKKAVLVTIPYDEDALDVKISLPRTIQLDSTSKIVLTVHTGRNQVDSVTLKITGPTGIQFGTSDAALVNESKVRAWSATDDSIILEGIKPRQTAQISIPHSYPSQGGFVDAVIEATYQVGNGDGHEGDAQQPLRTLLVGRRISVALPVTVNVRDFFRGKTLLSKFTISTHLHQQVRIADVKLQGGSDLVITPCRKGPNIPRVTIAPNRPSHFLFQLESLQERKERETLRLSIQYRTLREEIEALIAYNVKQVLATQPNLIDSAIASLVEALAKDANWVELYIAAGELHIGGIKALGGELGKAVGTVAERLSKGGPEATPPVRADDWRELVIPVDMPFLNILSAVRIELPNESDNDNQATFYAGQPISIKVHIHTAFHWGSTGHETPEFRMRYDLEDVLEDWLVSGKKRGDFLAKDNETFTLPLTLIALHHGELALPQVQVHPLPLTSGNGYDMRNASLALPSAETYQVRAADRIMVLPRAGRRTFVVGMGGDD